MTHKLGTDRTDWKIVAECSEQGEGHLRLEATAKGAAPGYQNPVELFPIEECPGCGADMAYIKQEEPHEVLE